MTLYCTDVPLHFITDVCALHCSTTTDNHHDDQHELLPVTESTNPTTFTSYYRSRVTPHFTQW